MVNTVNCYLSILHKVMKQAGMQPKQVEIEPGTVINLWVPIQSPNSSKPPLVLIHGFAGNGILTWQFQVLSSLRKNYSLYVPDLLFFGGSHTSRAERTPRFQADCLAAGLRKLLGHEEKCIVVGLSYGGFVGFQMAEHHPDLVESMVVTGSVLALSQSISKKGLERIGFSSWSEFLMPNSVEGLKVMLDVGSYKLPWLPNFFYKHFLEVMFSNRKERVELLEALVIPDEDVTNYQFEQMIHLLWGNEDRILNMEVANDLKERLGGKTKLISLKKAGHLAPMERPCAFNKALEELLASFCGQLSNTHQAN